MEISFLLQTGFDLKSTRLNEGRGATFQWNSAARAASKRPNCKGPPGLPCAVTPLGTLPPCVPSNPITIMTIFGMNVCPVGNSHKVGSQTRVLLWKVEIRDANPGKSGGCGGADIGHRNEFWVPHVPVLHVGCLTLVLAGWATITPQEGVPLSL